ncbi:DUF3135 domain-containing protein [Nitrincola schmidtii]|uniref:DUF3135 domain-containing protein n=1 Tax=Nitrincola schmidtii TaxID=1730894 RepID=UPI00124E34EB|nr:DUF3135 domain-containing protein [Nitrincola schmidtii]
MENIVPSQQVLPPFEELAYLARNNSEQFEIIRRNIITNEIAMCRSNQLHLERLQFRLDGIFRKHKNPYTRCQLLLNMIAETSHKISYGLDILKVTKPEIIDENKSKLSVVK